MPNKQISDIRMAAESDVDSIVDLLHEMHNENGIGRFEGDRARHTVLVGIARQGGVVGVIRGDDGVVEASIGLFIGATWYSSDPHLFDLWSYVGVSYRKTTHAKQMLLFAKRAALDLQLPLMMTVIANKQTARKEQLFERQLSKAGSLFLFNNGNHNELHV